MDHEHGQGAATLLPASETGTGGKSLPARLNRSPPRPGQRARQRAACHGRGPENKIPRCLLARTTVRHPLFTTSKPPGAATPTAASRPCRAASHGGDRLHLAQGAVEDVQCRPGRRRHREVARRALRFRHGAAPRPRGRHRRGGAALAGRPARRPRRPPGDRPRPREQRRRGGRADHQGPRPGERQDAAHAR